MYCIISKSIILVLSHIIITKKIDLAKCHIFLCCDEQYLPIKFIAVWVVNQIKTTLFLSNILSQKFFFHNAESSYAILVLFLPLICRWKTWATTVLLTKGLEKIRRALLNRLAIIPQIAVVLLAWRRGLNQIQLIVLALYSSSKNNGGSATKSSDHHISDATDNGSTEKKTTSKSDTNDHSSSSKKGESSSHILYFV